MRLHITLTSVLWTLISGGWVCISITVLRIFWGGVKVAARVPDRGMRRALALDLAWDYFNSEALRLAMHVPSFLIGVASLFVPAAPRQTVPTVVTVFGVIVLFYLFLLNVLVGVNTLRALRSWRRRQGLIQGKPFPRYRRTPDERDTLARLVVRLRALARRQGQTETRVRTEEIRNDASEVVIRDHGERLEVIEEEVSVKRTTTKALDDQSDHE